MVMDEFNGLDFTRNENENEALLCVVQHFQTTWMNSIP